MALNAGFEYAAAEMKYQQAKSPEAKLEALLEMQRTAPKHKASEGLLREISKKISLVRLDIEKQKEQAKKGGGISFNVKKEGDGQIVLVGFPNSGKSTVLNALTGASVAVSEYEFTTTEPALAALRYNGAIVQLVEVPAIIEGSSQGKANGTQFLSVIRNADAVILVLDAANAAQEFAVIKKELLNAKIRLNEKKPDIKIEQSEYSGISIAGKQFLKMPLEELEQLLKSLGFYKASVVLNEELKDSGKILQVLDEGIVYKRALAIINNKTGQPLQINPISAGSDVVLFEVSKIEDLKQKVFSLLDKIIVFTKKPGQPADKNDPLVLKKGTKVDEVPALLHKDFAKNLKYVKIWGSAKFEGQRVSKDYVLAPFDTIEIYS